MIRRLVEAHFVQYREDPTPEQIAFWLQECRTTAILFELARQYPGPLAIAAKRRPLLSLIQAGDEAALQGALDMEEKQEREADRAYWIPLRAELEELRHRTREN